LVKHHLARIKIKSSNLNVIPILNIVCVLTKEEFHA